MTFPYAVQRGELKRQREISISDRLENLCRYLEEDCAKHTKEIQDYVKEKCIKEIKEIIR